MELAIRGDHLTFANVLKQPRSKLCNWAANFLFHPRFGKLENALRVNFTHSVCEVCSTRRTKAYRRCDYKFKIGATRILLSSKFWEVRECAWSLKLHPQIVCEVCSHIFSTDLLGIVFNSRRSAGALHFSDCQQLSKV